MKGLDTARAAAERACRMCGLPMRTRMNLGVSRRLPLGMQLLMGAFAASLDASPLLAPEHPPIPGFARASRYTLDDSDAVARPASLD